MAEIRRRCNLDAKLVLITNATRFQHAPVREGLNVLDANGGEIWAKLEAGTEDYYQQVDRSTISLRRVLANITEAAGVRPLVIQSLFMKLHDQPPPAEELAAFCDRLQEIVQAGGKISLDQVYTVTRVPAETYVWPLSNPEVDRVTSANAHRGRSILRAMV